MRALASPRSAAVIGGGLAGIAAATTLADRGFAVTIFEAAPRIGGKIGGSALRVDGTDVEIDHGFHAFFRNYHNLNRFLRRVNIAQTLRPIDDYAIVELSGVVARFGSVETVPGLNLLDLARLGLYRMREVLLSRARHHMNVFLEYDASSTFEALDNESYAAFAERAGLPRRLRKIFSTFARAFFAEDDRLSMAELVKAFHFYYLSHDRGLLYDYPTASYLTGIVAPIEGLLASLGVTIESSVAVQSVAIGTGGFEIEGRTFDNVVVATPAKEAAALFARSDDLSRTCPETARRLAALAHGQRYAVLRVWIDKDLRDDVPVFVATEREVLLDAVATYHRVTEADARWVAARGGGAVLELHSYAVPDAIASDDVERMLLNELARRFPEVEGLTVLHRHLRIGDDFTALHVGMHAARPGTTTDHPRLLLAGDWVRLPVPAMLMEGAFTSGLLAANAILRREGIRQETVLTVPPRGLLARPPRRAAEPPGGRRVSTPLASGV